MASVSEILDGRIGGVRGTFGAENITRSFHVITDVYTDDPSAVLQTESGGVTLGSGHPWGAYGVVVIGFSERERLTQTEWIVDAIYGAPLVVTQNNLWDVSIDVGLETYTEYVDLDGQVVGPGVYHPMPKESEYPGELLMQEIQRIRSLGYNMEAPFYAATPSGGWQSLRRLTNDKRRAMGLSRTRKMAQLELNKTLPRLAASQIAAVQNMVNTVNKSTFYGASTGTAKFIGMKASSMQGVLPGQAVENVVWPVSLYFSINWDGHNPTNQADIYEHSDGTQSAIEDDRGRVVKRSYKFYEKLEYNAILSWLDR